MGLRDQERRRLAEIEQGLTEQDPRFATTVQNLNSKVGVVPRVIKIVLVILASYVVGLMTIVGGVWLSSAILVVLGGVITASMPVVVGWRSWREHRVDPRPADAEPVDPSG